MPEPRTGTASRPWDQLPNEDDDAYARFLKWLHRGRTRRLIDVPDHLEAERRHWASRAHAFDMHQFLHEYPRQLERLAANLAALQAVAAAAVRFGSDRPAPPAA
jgi:hypothetical protein